MSIAPACLLQVSAGAIALLLTGAHPLPAQEKLAPVAAEWRVKADFQKSADARTNLSGAACAPTVPQFTSCLIVNDEKKYAQFLSIEGRRITPRALIRLVHQDADGNPDAEGAAYADGFFYIVGSHGRGRHSDKRNDSSYAVFRFPVDKGTGKPAFKVSEDEVVGVKSSTRLRGALRGGDGINDFFNKPLAKGGVNVEGIAVKNGRMHLGLRGPSIEEHAFILSVDADAVFTKNQSLDASVRRLKLGTNAGIRDLASVRDGLLVLAGPLNEQKEVKPALFHWNEKSGALKRLGELKRPASLQGGAKAEIVLVLHDKPHEPLRVLVMFDGPENGAPTEYLVPR
jgi:hypothetical protein